MTWSGTWFAAREADTKRLWKVKRTRAVNVFTGEPMRATHLLVDEDALYRMPSVTRNWLCSTEVAMLFDTPQLDEVVEGHESVVYRVPDERVRDLVRRKPTARQLHAEWASRLGRRWKVLNSKPSRARLDDFRLDHVEGFAQVARRAAARGRSLYGYVDASSGEWFTCNATERGRAWKVRKDDGVLQLDPPEPVVEGSFLNVGPVSALFGVAASRFEEILCWNGRTAIVRVPDDAVKAWLARADKASAEALLDAWKSRLKRRWEQDRRSRPTDAFQMAFTENHTAKLAQLAAEALRIDGHLYGWDRQ